MMTTLRQKTALILWLVIFAFVALIVIDWGMDYSRTSRTSQQNNVGAINGEPISLKEFQNALRLVARQRPRNQREDQGELVRQVWNAIVQDRLLGQEMKRLGLQVTDKEIAFYTRTQPPPAVREMPAFQTDGKFDPDKYARFLSDPSLLQNPTNKAFVLQVENMLKEQLMNYKLQRLIMETVQVSPAEVREYYAEQREKVEVEYLHVPSSAIPEGEVEVSEAELETYYQEHQDEFRHPEQIRIEYVYIPKIASAEDSLQIAEEIRRLHQEVLAGADFAELASAVSEDPGSADKGGDLGTFGRGQMDSQFEAAAFALPEGGISEPVLTRFGWHLIKVEKRFQEEGKDKVQARHLLLTFKPSRQTEERLRAQAEEFQAQAKAEGFQVAAAAAGLPVRDSGYLRRGMPVSELGQGTTWIVNTLFESEVGTVSRVDETETGLWVAHLIERRPSGVTPLAEVRSQIERAVRNRKRAEKAGERLVSVRQQVLAGASLEQAGRNAGLEVKRLPPFSRNESIPGVGRRNAFVAAAFQLQPGQISEVVVVPQRGAYLIRAISRMPVDEAQFQTEREQVAEQLLRQRQEEAVQNWLAHVFNTAQIEDYRHHFYTF